MVQPIHCDAELWGWVWWVHICFSSIFFSSSILSVNVSPGGRGLMNRSYTVFDVEFSASLSLLWGWMEPRLQYFHFLWIDKQQQVVSNWSISYYHTGLCSSSGTRTTWNIPVWFLFDILTRRWYQGDASLTKNTIKGTSIQYQSFMLGLYVTGKALPWILDFILYHHKIILSQHCKNC